MTPEAIDTIIAAVGLEPHDRRQLNVLLERVRGMIRGWRETKSYQVKSIRRAIEGVARMVESNPGARSLEPGITAVLDEARQLEVASKGRRLSVTDHLCGTLLPQLFQIQFGRPTTTPNGRYVKFAVAALKALGETITPGTVVRSRSAVKRANRMGKN